MLLLFSVLAAALSLHAIFEIDWSAYVRKAWGDEWHRRETVYIFGNGKTKKDSGGNSGIYSGTSA